jgi:hypothetical protein
VPKDIWDYRDSRHVPGGDVDLSGFEVVGPDGAIGVVDKLTRDVSATYLVVDTGDWHPNHQVILPAYTIERVEAGARVVKVDRSREEIAQAPDLTPAEMRAARAMDQLTGYYHGLYDTGL